MSSPYVTHRYHGKNRNHLDENHKLLFLIDDRSESDLVDSACEGRSVLVLDAEELGFEIGEGVEAFLVLLEEDDEKEEKGAEWGRSA